MQIAELLVVKWLQWICWWMSCHLRLLALELFIMSYVSCWLLIRRHNRYLRSTHILHWPWLSVPSIYGQLVMTVNVQQITVGTKYRVEMQTRLIAFPSPLMQFVITQIYDCWLSIQEALIWQSKSCQLLHNSAGTTCVTDLKQIKVMELNGYSRPRITDLCIQPQLARPS